MNKPTYYFYLISNEQWLAVTRNPDVTALLLECQPYGKQRVYRIVSQSPLSEYETLTCKDTGRTAGWWQTFMGTGIYRPKRGKIKLPENVKSIVKSLTPGSVTIAGTTWTAILESYVQKMDSKLINKENVINE